jgi:acyl-CoA synthetase (AMP-forming)/AMP-acid ligase II
MPVPLAVAAPAAVAGIAYLNARMSFGNDYRLIGSVIRCAVICSAREKKDRLNLFYILEQHALGKLANTTFLIFQGRQWTYKEFYDTSLRYGTWLRTEYDIKPKEIVAVDFMNSEKFLFIWIGLWSIGAKPAFINYNLTSKALSHCIRVSTARLILIDPEVQHNVTQEVRDELKGIQFEVFTPELEAEVYKTEAIRAPDADRSEDKASNMAMLIYTSGTTGLPKPAVVSWKKVITGSNVVPAFLQLRRGDIFYSSMPLYHSSAAILGFSTTITAGITFSLGKKFGTKIFWEDVRDSKATVIQYVGETCRYLLSAPPQTDPVTGEDLDKKHSVRIAFGNGLRPDIWDRFKERFGIEAIGEFYAATEGVSGAWNFSKNDYSRGAIGRMGTIGKVFTDKTSARVALDWETEQPYRDPVTGFCRKLPRGNEPGELLYKVDAENISNSYQGYFNNKDSTDSKIMRDVFEKGDAWFRTGDMISSDEEGRTYFSDRIGDTFRWKSENVSTNEVSEALGSHPVVHEANVYGVELPHHDGRAGCVAIVLAEEPNERLLRDLAVHATSRLPRFAVPLFLRRMRNMQITGTNKQQKHVVRKEGVDPTKVGDDELFWLKDGTYVKFGKRDWEELNGGRVKL